MVDETDHPSSESESGVSDHAQDYLQNLRARFDELTGRIEEAARAPTEEREEPVEEADDVDSAVVGGAAAVPTVAAASPAREAEVEPRRRVARPPLPAPVAPRRRWLRNGIVILLGAAIAVGAGFLVGRWWTDRSSDEPAPTAAPTAPATTVAPTPPADADLATAAEAAIAASGESDVAVSVTDGIARLEGTVSDEAALDALPAAVLEIEGMQGVDSRLQVFEEPPPPDPEAIQAAVDQALQDTGFEHLVVAVADGTATISGVVPFEEAAGGFFAYSAPLRDALLDIDGIDEVIPQLQLRGDEASLRSQLTALIDATPIVFASNSADLDETATAALDQAADIIIAHPGLRVLIAGHADTVGGTVPNEELAAARGAVVLQYLVGRGVPVTRMQVVSYGELFPGQDEGIDRRVEFEVAP